MENDIEQLNEQLSLLESFDAVNEMEKDNINHMKNKIKHRLFILRLKNHGVKTDDIKWLFSKP